MASRACVSWGGLWAIGCAAISCAASGCAHPALMAAPPIAAASAAPAPTARFASPYTYEWFVRAEVLRALGQLEAAIEAYRAALAGADEDAHLLARLATALDEQGDHRQAAKLLDDAAELEPDSEAVWLARAELAERLGDLAAAFSAFERAEQVQPLSPRAPLGLARLLRARGHLERADAVLLRYEARTLPGTRGAQEARLRRALLGRDPDRVFAATLPYRLQALIVPALVEAAGFLFEQGRVGQALRVIELVPPLLTESSLRLRILLACGRWSAAEAWLTGHAPARPEERGEFARAYLALRRPELAAQLLAAAELEQPDEPSLQLIAAQIAQARGAYAEAAVQFARIHVGSTAFEAARLGLAAALSAQGLPELAAEIAATMHSRPSEPTQ